MIKDRDGTESGMPVIRCYSLRDHRCDRIAVHFFLCNDYSAAYCETHQIQGLSRFSCSLEEFLVGRVMRS